MKVETRFGNPAAAQLWDETFRWRAGARLLDVTIDDTWRRVADALARAGGGSDEDLRAVAYAQDFARWRLLPDASLLALAGTRIPLQGRVRVRVVINCAAFAMPARRHATLDWGAVGSTARLAAWLADDVALAAGCEPACARLDVIGIGTAFARLGIDPATREAHRLAARFAVTLASGVMEASIHLARERGSLRPASSDLIERWSPLGLDPELIEAARLHGVRTIAFPRIARAPLLARLAATSDALEFAPGSVPAFAVSCTPEATEALGRAMSPWVERDAETDIGEAAPVGLWKDAAVPD